VRAPSLEVDAMDERLNVATLDSPGCPVGERIGSFIGSGNSSGLDITSISTYSLTDGLGLLESGDADILALPGGLVHGNMMEILQSGCNVVGARTPVRPYPVLVSDNKIQYQPKSAILLCENKLNRRQLRRSRGGLRVLDPDAFASIVGIEEGPSDPFMRAKWMENLRGAGEIDGFVIPRGIYEGADLVSRRHSLLPDGLNEGDPDFLPPAYSDLIVLLARNRFPKSISKEISEREGETCWWVQNSMLGSLDPEMLEKIGVLVRHRQVRSLIKQAEATRDLTLEQVCLDPDGEVIEDEVHVEIRLEFVSKDGARTIGLHRVIRHSDYERATIASLRDWETMIKEVSRDVPKDFHTDPESPPFILLDE
tara:strand:- start:594 stop:1694 length:1101 start_codon:yes stop_codon:yes gene_type:complete